MFVASCKLSITNWISSCNEISFKLFFVGLLYYFITLIWSSIFRTYITSRGLVCLFSSALLLLIILYFSNFSYFIFEEGRANLQFNLFQSLWFSLPISLEYSVDFIGFLFGILVLLIGFATNLYILSYFRDEGREDTFILFINWFIFSMLTLVSAGNLITVILGWELIGLTSFFLINFWYARRMTLLSSVKAFVFNKISDLFLLLCFFLIWRNTGILNLHELTIKYTTFNVVDMAWIKYAAVYLIICSAIKSAQIIGHLWLPDSMEAPVPASALIHSATLVSAGVYLCLRFNWLIELADYFDAITLLGAITAAYGGVIAAVQTDIKRLLAYSTISHCGFLFVCLGLQNLLLTFLYLFLHGFFKAMSFFCAGSIIRLANTQDIRKMGQISRIAPVESTLFIISVANLAGFPFTFGAFYKHIFLLLINQHINLFIVGLCYLGLLSSVVYAFRLLYFSLFNMQKSKVSTIHLKLQETNTNFKNNKQATWFFIIALVILFISSFFFYKFFFAWIYTWPITVTINGITTANLPISWLDLEQASEEYFIYFYAIYMLVIVLCLLYEWRSSATFIYRLSFMVMAYCLSILFYLTTLANVIDYALNWGFFNLYEYIIDYDASFDLFCLFI